MLFSSFFFLFLLFSIVLPFLARSSFFPYFSCTWIKKIKESFFSLDNLIGDRGASSLLSPLANLLNLSKLTLNLSSNRIGDIGSSSLLCPIENIVNLSELTLDLRRNNISDIGIYSIVYPLSNLMNLSSLDLQLRNFFKTKNKTYFQALSLQKIKALRFVGLKCVYFLHIFLILKYG